MLQGRISSKVILNQIFFLGLFLLALSPFSVLAQVDGHLLVGSNEQQATIWHIDLNSGVATALHSSDQGDASAWGMAYDPDSSTLFWNNSSTLYSSPYTPGSLNLVPTILGEILYLGDNFSINGLAVFGGRLYGTSEELDRLFEIDLSTLQASIAQQYIGPASVSGIGIDLLNGELYGADNSKRAILRYDMSAQTEAPVANFPSQLQSSSYEGLAAFSNKAYIVANRLGSSTVDGIYVVDLSTGSVVDSFPSPFSTIPSQASAAFIPADADADGTFDYLDNCKGVANASQSDSDGDGKGDACDLCTLDPGKTFDVDSDSDGVLDCNDSCPSDPDKLDPGLCGCGIGEEDPDGDSVPSCFDNCAADPAKSSPGVCGCGVSDADLNANGVPDCLPQVEFVNAFERILDLLRLLRQNLKKLTRDALTSGEIKAQIKSALNDLGNIKASALASTKSQKKTNKLVKRAKKKVKQALKTKKRDARKRNKRAVRAVKRVLKVVG